MQNKTTVRNAFSLLVIILVSTIPVTGLPVRLGQDVWISLLLTMIPVFPLLVIYSRLTALMPEKDIFEMAEEVLGKTGARITGFLFGIYFVYMTSFVIYNFAELIHLTSLFKTPMILVVFILVLAALYLAKSGIETIGKWANIMVIVLFTVLIITTLASLKFIDFSNLLPVMSHSPKEIIKGSLQFVSYPFGESVVMLIILSTLKKEDLRPYKINIGGTFMAMLFILIAVLRTITVLGPVMMDTSLFSVYKATSLLKVGNYLQRIEAIIEYIYIMAGMIKIAVYIAAGSRAVSKVINIKNRKIMIIPIGLLAAALSTIIFNNNLHVYDFYKSFSLYSIPFQILIPVLIWIFAEIKFKKIDRRV